MARSGATHDEILRGRLALHLLFPKCVAPKGGDKTPLKIGISKELCRRAHEAYPELNLRIIKATLRDYTTGHKYLVNMIAGRHRIDLDGNPADMITAENERAAKERIAYDRRVWMAKRRSAKRFAALDAVTAGAAAGAHLAEAAKALHATAAKLKQQTKSAMIPAGDANV